jgi:hypothetical protein
MSKSNLVSISAFASLAIFLTSLSEHMTLQQGINMHGLDILPIIYPKYDPELDPLGDRFT